MRILFALLLLAPLSFSPPQRTEIPTRLADTTFWRMVSTFSEPSGYFSSENFVSNETEWQMVIPNLLARLTPGAYLGVGPEQNFTYIAAFHPRIAFICDIRRQNLIEHLMYKALIETSRDRVDFLSKLWSRRVPEGIDSTTAPDSIVAAFAREKPDSLFYTLNLGAILDRLVNTHKFALSSEDSASIRTVYGVFFGNGPETSYSSSSRPGALNAMSNGISVRGSSISSNGANVWISGSSTITYYNGGATMTYRMTTDSAGRLRVTRDSAGVSVPDTTFRFQANGAIPQFGGALPQFITANAGRGFYATFGSLMAEDDGAGMNRGWLGSEAAFRTVKDYQTRNLIVPVVGDFGGPKALRAIGAYLKEHDTRVTAFYTSNVEQYLFQNAVNGKFYENVATLPTDSASMFIRSIPPQFGAGLMPRKPLARLTQTTSTIDAILRAHRAGSLNAYTDLGRLQDR